MNKHGELLAISIITNWEVLIKNNHNYVICLIHSVSTKIQSSYGPRGGWKRNKRTEKLFMLTAFFESIRWGIALKKGSNIEWWP